MKTSRFACIATVLFILLPSVAGAGDADGKLNLRLPAGQPEVFERVEIAVEGVPAAANPFDPESIALDLEVTQPSGQQLRVPGYFQRDFDRKLEGNREVLTPKGEGNSVPMQIPPGALPPLAAPGSGPAHAGRDGDARQASPRGEVRPPSRWPPASVTAWHASSPRASITSVWTMARRCF